MIKSLINLILAFGHKVRDDNVDAISAHVTFFIALSFFPFIMFFLTLLNYLPISTDLLSVVSLDFFPETVSVFVSGILDELKRSASGALLSVTVIAAIWSASRGFLALIRGLNRIYNKKETRNYFVLRFVATIYTVVFAILVILVLVIFVFGNQITLWITAHFPAIENYALLVISMRSAAGFGILVFFFLLIFKRIPNRKTNLLRELPGALLAAVGWIGFSFLYSIYINRLSNFTATYGSLTAVVLCLLWLYFCMYILFIGAELNVILSNSIIHDAFTKLFSRRKQRRKRRFVRADKIKPSKSDISNI